MASKISVANHALYLLGQGRITALTDESAQARAFNDIFDDVRDEVLEQHPWNFATTRATLAASAIAPDHKYSTAYPLPEDFIRLVRLNDETISASAGWRIESHQGARAILTSVGAMQIEYIYRVTDPNLWSPLFGKALAAKLAYELAVKFRASDTAKRTAFGEYQEALGDAALVDSSQAPVEQFDPRTFADARQGDRTYRAIKAN